LSFSPHYENLLATSSADCTLKLWNIPDEGLTASIKQSDAELCGHTKKIMLL
jgi:WD40 repeat protein